jgi:FkbM family methyltransferase
LRASIQTAEEIRRLKELVVDGIYNMLFLGPTVVLDVGMGVGLASIFFASQPDVVVVGFEPYETLYNRALDNISLNPHLADKILALKATVGTTKFDTIAAKVPNVLSQPSSPDFRSDHQMELAFEYEEIEVEDVAERMGAIAAAHPGRDVVLKIDLEFSEYYIDGVSEQLIIDRLHSTGKLKLVRAVMLKWHKRRLGDYPHDITRQLHDCGFVVFLFAPFDPHTGMLYAVRNNSAYCPQSLVV